MYPTLNPAEEQTPIAIEYAYFLEDGEQDPTKFNRYYFNFPQEWCTSNRGESIVGVRNMWLIARRRKLEFTITLAKFEKQYFDKVEGNDTTSKINNMMISYKDNIKVKDIKVIDWVSIEGDFRGFFDAIHKSLQNYIKSWWNDPKEIFKQSDDDILDRDIQSDGYYDERGFHEKIFSERNNNEADKYGMAFKLKETNKDFDEVFNIGDGANQNKKDVYLKYYDKVLTFDNVWDRHSCKVYSSIAEQSNHNYIGNSNVDLIPIKYFKLNSTDQRFWIELYSGREYKAPFKLPNGESFVIEMIFLPYHKLLYF